MLSKLFKENFVSSYSFIDGSNSEKTKAAYSCIYFENWNYMNEINWNNMAIRFLYVKSKQIKKNISQNSMITGFHWNEPEVDKFLLDKI